MKSTVWKFGLISGVVLAGMFVLTMPFQDAIGYDRAEILGYTWMVAAFLLVYFGIRSYRDSVGGGTVGFGRAVAVGTLIAMIATVCYTITWEAIYFGARPDFTAKYTAHQLDKARARGATQAQLDQQAAEMRKFARLYDNPFYNTALTLLEPLPVAIVVTLVSAGVLSRKPRRGSPRIATSTAGLDAR